MGKQSKKLFSFLSSTIINVRTNYLFIELNRFLNFQFFKIQFKGDFNTIINSLFIYLFNK